MRRKPSADFRNISEVEQIDEKLIKKLRKAILLQAAKMEMKWKPH